MVWRKMFKKNVGFSLLSWLHKIIRGGEQLLQGSRPRWRGIIIQGLYLPTRSLNSPLYRQCFTTNKFFNKSARGWPSMWTEPRYPMRLHTARAHYNKGRTLLRFFGLGFAYTCFTLPPPFFYMDAHSTALSWDRWNTMFFVRQVHNGWRPIGLSIYSSYNGSSFNLKSFCTVKALHFLYLVFFSRTKYSFSII